MPNIMEVSFIEAAERTIPAQMMFLKQFQRENTRVETVGKEDGTIQIAPDRFSDDIGLRAMCDLLPNHRRWGEESGYEGDETARYLVGQDGLDGTSAFKNGLPTYCVGWFEHDTRTQKLIGAAAIDTMGRFMTFDPTNGTRVNYWEGHGFANDYEP